MSDHTADVTRTMQAYDAIAADYAERTWQMPLDSMREEFLAAALARKPGRPLRLLDAGCGPGRDLAWFGSRGQRVVGGDLSAGMLAEARRRVPGAALLRMDLRRPPFGLGAFDAIWLCAALLHVPKDEWLPTLHRYRDLLAGGLLFVSVKHGEGERRVTDGLLRRRRRFFSYATEEGLRHLLTEAGFRVLLFTRGPGEPGHDWLHVHAEPR